MGARFTYEEVYNYFKKYRCELLEKEYINATTSMKYICSCGNKTSSSFYKFKNGDKSCRKCAQYKKKGLDVSNLNIKSYTKQELIDEFFRFHKENGKYPKITDLKIENGYPSVSHYYKEWGTWNNFLKELDILGSDGWYKCDEQVLIDMYETEPKEKIMEALMVKRKWEAIIKKATKLGLKRSNRVGRGKPDITKEYLIDCFWNFYKEYGRYPLAKDFQKATDKYPSIYSFTRKFGSWDNFLKEIGVVDKDTDDGWYKHDEDLLRKYYPDNNIEMIMKNLMIKRSEQAIRQKANKMGLKVKKEKRYVLKYKNEETKQKLIQEAIDFYNKNGRSPYKYELSLSRKAIEQNWESYNSFLKECGLPLLRKEVDLISKDDGIRFLLKLKEDLGRNPTVNDVEENGVHKNWFANMFGSFTQALYEAGLILKKDADKEFKLNKSINEFKNLYNKLKRVPTYKEYKECASKYGLYYPNQLIEKLNVSNYTELCKKLVGECNKNEYDKEKMIQDLIDLKNKLGRVPMGKELEEHGLHSLYTYKYVFNKRYFNDIIRELGWEPSGHDPIFKTDEELLNDYLELYKKLGRIPMSDDINEQNDMCHSATYIARFGSLFAVCDLLDIDYRNMMIDYKTGAGKTCFDKNGELCRSIPEMKITDFLIDKDIKYIKEYPYKNLIKNENDKRRFDWYLPDYNICIEYFGLFDKDSLGDDTRIGDYSRKTVQKINDCRNANIVLIDLYPEDIKNNLLGFKTKINKYLKTNDLKVMK